MKKTFLVFFLILISNLGFSQTDQERRDEINKQMEELMKARADMIRSLMDDSAFDNFDKHFEDLVKKFQQNGFPDGLNNSDLGAGDVVGEYDWRETEAYKIFVLKVKQIKDKPLDIKIEKGQIKLSIL